MLVNVANSDYEVDVINNIVVIYDLDLGNASVTNDIVNVLDDIHHNFTNIIGKKIIYQDSDGVFDGVLINAQAKFVAFYPIRETELEKALDKLMLEYRRYA